MLDVEDDELEAAELEEEEVVEVSEVLDVVADEVEEEGALPRLRAA